VTHLCEGQRATVLQLPSGAKVKERGTPVESAVEQDPLIA